MSANITNITESFRIVHCFEAVCGVLRGPTMGKCPFFCGTFGGHYSVCSITGKDIDPSVIMASRDLPIECPLRNRRFVVQHATIGA